MKYFTLSDTLSCVFGFKTLQEQETVLLGIPNWDAVVGWTWGSWLIAVERSKLGNERSIDLCIGECCSFELRRLICDSQVSSV